MHDLMIRKLLPFRSPLLDLDSSGLDISLDRYPILPAPGFKLGRRLERLETFET